MSTLSEKLKGWKRVMSARSSGVLHISIEICEVARNWEAYKDEAEGLTANEWIRKYLDKSISFFERRAEAVAFLEREDVRRWMDHEVAVWLYHQNYPKEINDKIVDELYRITLARGSNAQSLGVGIRVAYAIAGHTQASKQCPRCLKLREAFFTLLEWNTAQGHEVPLHIVRLVD